MRGLYGAAQRIAHQLQRLLSLDTIQRSLKMKCCQLHALVRRRAAKGAHLVPAPTIGALALPPRVSARRGPGLAWDLCFDLSRAAPPLKPPARSKESTTREIKRVRPRVRLTDRASAAAP
jgi:hypothetical protein